MHPDKALLEAHAVGPLVDAVHLRLCAASLVIACQLSPECPSEIFAGPHCFVSRDSTRRGWLPELRILAWRDDGSGTSSGNHIVTSARVIGSVSSDHGNLLIRRDLVQKVGQHGGVADVACCDRYASERAAAHPRHFTNLNCPIAASVRHSTAIEHNKNIWVVAVPKGKVERLVPLRFQTVGRMDDEGVEVRAYCRTCDLLLEVSPKLLRQAYGDNYSLIGRRLKCRRVGCDGTVLFMAEGHGRFEPLS